jgi:5-methylcytosine-specific restriction endonuclease McrA
MSDSPVVAARALRDALCAFEPEAFTGEDCARLAEELAQTEKACAAASVRAAARAAGCGAQRGFGNATDWLGRISGASVGQARAVLDAAAAMEDCPQTKEAVVAGELSLVQGGEIAKTEAACPGTEAELVSLAKASSLGVLKDKARSRRLRAMDVEALHRRRQAARELRHWTDDMGMVRLAGALPPEVGVPIVSRLDAETDRIRKVARRRGSDEPRSAHGADALVRMLDSRGKGKADRADLVIVWDRTAAGEDHEGTAHIVGGGPIPVSVARKQAERSFVKGLIHDGVRIETVKHVGRSIPAELRTALELGDPPGFEGLICIDCGKRYGIQRDHINPVANGGLTAFDNLAGRCWDCHEKKTEADRQAGLLGRKGDEERSRGKREPP